MSKPGLGAATITAVMLMVAALAGIVIGIALTGPDLTENEQDRMIRCWSWYEGTYGGQQGAACPDWWPAGHP